MFALLLSSAWLFEMAISTGSTAIVAKPKTHAIYVIIMTGTLEFDLCG